MPETTTKEYLEFQVNKQGGVCHFIQSNNSQGFPNCICVFPFDFVVFVYVIQPQESLTSAMENTYQVLNSSNALVYIVNSDTSVNFFMQLLLQRSAKWRV